ncbi:hypothetical protein [Pantoea sp.]|uniref:hypothetical protein n=1 Tax=Pantoea sp. TaxID=69393 RepID=UPI00289C79E1|nr:hypothetical protein [Pantoea sp.]
MNAEGMECMPKDVQKTIEYWILSMGFFTLIAIFFLDRFGNEHKSAWISLFSAGYVCFAYLMTIYLSYGRSPNFQKRLKAIIDSFANFLAICTLIVAYISLEYYGKAGNLFEIIAKSGSGNILAGVIFGVLLSRVLFPFWDLYSKYRKV